MTGRSISFWIACPALVCIVLAAAPAIAADPVDELERGAPPPGAAVRTAPPLYGTQGANLPASTVGQPSGTQGPPGPSMVSGVGAGGGRPAPPPEPVLNPYQPLDDEHAAWRSPLPAPGQVAPGVRLLRMRDNTIGIVHTRAYKVSLIRLPPCEEITLASVGEDKGFVARVPGLTPKGGAAEARALGIPLNEVEINAKVSGSDTSLHVRTRSGRLYVFQIFAEKLDSKDVSDLTVLVEHDDACQPVALGSGTGSAAAPGDFVRRIPFDAARLRFDSYRAFGASPAVAWMAPQHIAFDGLWLFLDFGGKADQIAKPIAMNVVEGVPSPAQQEWIGQESATLVVKSPSDVVMLQSGASWICIRRVPEDHALPGVFAVDPALGKQ